MPQTNLPRGDEVGQVVRFTPTPLFADTRIGGYTFDGANDRLLREYASEGTCNAFAWVSASVNTPRDTLRLLTQRYSLTESVWCTATPERDARLPAGFTWVGVYYPMTYHDDRWNLARADVRVSFDCAHCAANAARHSCGGREWTVLAAMPGADLSAWEPLEGELLGSEATWETCMDGVEDLMWERSCSKCGLGGHNVVTCDLPVRYIDRMGIEIEGRWRNTTGRELASLRSRATTAGHSYTSDGSIRMHDSYFGLEIPTRPASLRDSLRALIDFYPDHTGEDCGMHVHVSFQDPTLVSQLCTPEFFAYFRESWEAFITEHRLSPRSQLARRLHDDNDYCGVNADHEATDITEIGRVDRYRQINFAAWHEHNTVEFRLLPMFVNARIGVAAVIHLTRLLNTWFASAADRLPAFCDLTAGNLAEEERDLRVCTGMEPVILPLPADLEVDPAPFIMGGTAEVAIPALPDIPAGHQRLAVTADQLTQLQAILGRAA